MYKLVFPCDATDETIMAHILKAAGVMLQMPARSVKEILEALGFGEVTHKKNVIYLDHYRAPAKGRVFAMPPLSKFLVGGYDTAQASSFVSHKFADSSLLYAGFPTQNSSPGGPSDGRLYVC